MPSDGCNESGNLEATVTMKPSGWLKSRWRKLDTGQLTETAEPEKLITMKLWLFHLGLKPFLPMMIMS